jgi:putative ABC transport system permease protein
MFKNYVVVALRNMMRHKAYSLITVLGLSAGIACCVLLSLYIHDELSYDKHHARLDDLYRITTDFTSVSGLDRMATTSPPIAQAMRREIPEVEAAARMLNPPDVPLNLIRYNDHFLYEADGYIADSTIFDVLTYEFLEGNPKTALADANTVVLTDVLAKKIFGNRPALNELISIAQGGPPREFKVTGVVRDNPRSHVHVNFFTSVLSQGWAEYLRSNEAEGEWAGQNFMIAYLKLVPNHDVKSVVQKMNEVLVKHGSEDMKALGMTKTLDLQPVKDIYLRNDINQSPRITYLYIIASIAAFILLIACINFMNLSTARATMRASEIGVRKVMGAFRSALIRQILGEAMVVVMISILLSLVLVQLFMPLFNTLTGKTIGLGGANLGSLLGALGILTIFTGLVAGSYPAFYLSSFEPAQVLKGKFRLSNSSSKLRQSLVVFQFIIAITLVCGMITITRQMSFIQKKDLGFSNDNTMIVLPLRTESAQQGYDALRKQLANQSGVTAVSGANYTPGMLIWNDMAFYTQGGSMDNAILNYRNRVDEGYMELMGIPLLAGRTFTDNRAQDSQNKVILNRASAKKFGFTPESAIGQKLFFDWQGQQYTFDVIGVMEDYHQTSLKDEIKPLMFQMPAEARYEYAMVKINGEHFDQALSSIEETWKSLVNDTPFEYSFLDQNIQKQYEEDRRVSRIISGFTIIAMIISCLGLYGLSTYMAERRFKEIGVRKVMGANIGQIVALLSREFLKLVFIAFVIAVPLSWYAIDQWLSGFAYHIPVDGLIFVYAGLLSLMVALLTVSYESIKAAVMNPIKSLRSE